MKQEIKEKIAETFNLIFISSIGLFGLSYLVGALTMVFQQLIVIMGIIVFQIPFMHLMTLTTIFISLGILNYAFIKLMIRLFYKELRKEIIIDTRKNILIFMGESVAIILITICTITELIIMLITMRGKNNEKRTER